MGSISPKFSFLVISGSSSAVRRITPDEYELLNVRKHVRHSSILYLAAECGALLPGDLVFRFLEKQVQAFYLDAHVLNAQIWRHDVRGCCCRFLVHYDHDQFVMVYDQYSSQRKMSTYVLTVYLVDIDMYCRHRYVMEHFVLLENVASNTIGLVH
ncbi:hypothetical protein C5167_040972 [Papaver somniferum]|uniref:SAWADEE domain-containing protein n=1 Tax=Papaver somniferum TaxID=3469 RepID=A0A4Y7IKN4_PAPSO|nr:hypothetical protein C5167_040972 [Papaver somniferum]